MVSSGRLDGSARPKQKYFDIRDDDALDAAFGLRDDEGPEDEAFDDTVAGATSQT